METKLNLVKPKHRLFLTKNKNCKKQLHQEILQRVALFAKFRNGVKHVSLTGISLAKELLQQQDQEVLKIIKQSMIIQVKAASKNDIEILKNLQQCGWIAEILESDLRQMGLQAELKYATSIIGKLKLKRIDAHQKVYKLLPLSIRKRGKKKKEINE